MRVLLQRQVPLFSVRSTQLLPSTLTTVAHLGWFHVTVPPGADDGQTLTLSGQGAAGAHGAPAGDLLVELAVRPSAQFVRDGADLRSEARITFSQAVLGAEIEVPTIDGRVKYRIPAGTQSGTSAGTQGGAAQQP